jgi:hypothetical protein
VRIKHKPKRMSVHPFRMRSKYFYAWLSDNDLVPLEKVVKSNQEAWNILHPKDGRLVLWENDLLIEITGAVKEELLLGKFKKEYKRNEKAVQEISEKCRNLNLLMLKNQKSWDFLGRIANHHRKIQEISQIIKERDAASSIRLQGEERAECNDSNNSGPNSYLSHSAHFCSIESNPDMQIEDDDATFNELSQSSKKLEQQRNKEHKLKDDAENEYFVEIRRQFECYHRLATDQPFPTGPVGESPVHDCFLFGLMEVGKKLIDMYYTTPELLSVRYLNDLDPWRKDPDWDDNKGGDINTEGASNINTGEESEEDGLYTGQTLLHISIKREDIGMVQYLLEQGIEISSRATGVSFQPKFRLPSIVGLAGPERIKANLQRFFAPDLQIENKDSEAYYGEYPLSFAASIGNLEICTLLYYSKQLRIQSCMHFESKKITAEEMCKMPRCEKDKASYHAVLSRRKLWQEKQTSIARMNSHLPIDFQHEPTQKLLMWEFVNAADSLGNTALHVAVWHRRKDIIDWILSMPEGSHSLSMLNHEAFTPLTLAVRRGDLEIFHHILYKYMGKTLLYGKVLLVSRNSCSGHIFGLDPDQKYLCTLLFRMIALNS